MKVAELMNREIAFVYSGDSVQRAIEEMATRDRGLVVVFTNDYERKVAGVLSNKDIINKVFAKNKSATATLVSEVMTKDFISVSPDSTTTQAMVLMRKYNIKRVLVMDNGVLQGVVSSNNILDAMIQYKKELLDMAIDF